MITREDIDARYKQYVFPDGMILARMSRADKAQYMTELATLDAAWRDRDFEMCDAVMRRIDSLKIRIMNPLPPVTGQIDIFVKGAVR